MRIWIVKDGENLPIEPGARKMRAWLLAEELLRRGHAVTWWTSTFSHARKTLFFSEDREVEISPSFRLRFLHAGSYRKNLSIGRYLQNQRLGSRFRKAAEREEPPDLVLAAFPIIDFADAAVAYAKRRGIPAIADVRDLWPDTFLDFCPRGLRPFARALLFFDYRKTRRLLRDANALVAISQGCLDWGRNLSARTPSEADRIFYTGYPDPKPAAAAPSPAVAKALQAFKGKTVFAYVGSFGRSYDLAPIVRAARRLHERGRQDIHFVLVGSGEQRARLQEEAGTLPNVSMPGWLDQESIEHVLKASHAGIVPGPHVPGAMPNKAFEYLAHGLPLLCSVTGELSRRIETHDIGRNYRKDDEASLEKRVEELAGEPQRLAEMSVRARSLFVQEFRAEKIYRDYADFVEKAAMDSRTAVAM